VAGINHQRVAFRAPEIDRGRKPSDPAADDDHFTPVRIIDVFMLDHAEY
jgi:hypothetical protein